MTKTPGLDGALKDLGDVIKDTEAALGANQSVLQRLMQYSNLFGDLMVEIPLIPGIKAEVAALQPDDYGRLASELAASIGLASPHAVAIVSALVKFVADGLVADAIGVFHAIVAKP